METVQCACRPCLVSKRRSGCLHVDMSFILRCVLCYPFDSGRAFILKVSSALLHLQFAVHPTMADHFENVSSVPRHGLFTSAGNPRTRCKIPRLFHIAPGRREGAGFRWWFPWVQSCGNTDHVSAVPGRHLQQRTSEKSPSGDHSRPSAPAGNFFSASIYSIRRFCVAICHGWGGGC